MLKFALILQMVFFIHCNRNSNPNLNWILGLAQSTAQAAIPNPGPNTPNVPSNPNSPAVNDTQEFTMTISDETGEPTDFIFNTTQTITLNILAFNALTDNPAEGTLVQIIDNDRPTVETFFQAVVDSNGSVKGSFTINNTTSQVLLVLTYKGQSYKILVDIKGVYNIRRTVYFITTHQVELYADSDGDGVEDSKDEYPNDPTRSAKIIYPLYTISYEDLYPRQGDADFNDYSVQVKYEEDLNSKGEVARIRANYTHIAKGAGYNHTLNLNLPKLVNANYSLKRYSANGLLESELNQTVNEFKGIEILPNSSTTLSRSNTTRGQSFVIGKKAELEVILSTPISKLELGSAPYDLYLNVLTTRQEIHFAGYYKNSNGEDLYLDANGFPWAILIPGQWRWPYERTNIHNSYLKFKNWYLSKGTEFKDWYLYPELNEVYPVF
jgi:LruC domain-containing protein